MGRWEDPKTGEKTGENYSTGGAGSHRSEQVRKPRDLCDVAASPAAGVAVESRHRASDVGRAAAVERASARCSVFRRWLNSAFTSRSNSRSSGTRTAGAAEVEPDDAGPDLRRRREGAGRQVEQPRDRRVDAEQDRQHAVVLGAGPRDQPVRDLALQHHRRVGEEPVPPVQVDQAEQDRRREVVRQVADDAKPARRRAGRPRSRGPLRLEAAQKRDDVGLEKSAGEQRDVRRRTTCEQSPPGRDRSRRPGSAAPVAASGSVSAPVPGPISRNTSPGARADGGDDLRRPGGRQEVLAEPLADGGARGRIVAATSSLTRPDRLSPRQYRSSISSISSSDSPK